MKTTAIKKTFIAAMSMAVLTSCSTVKTDTAPTPISEENEPTGSVTSVEDVKPVGDTVIKLAVSGESDYITKAVNNFNSEDNGYKVELVTYEYNTETGSDGFQLNNFELVQDIVNKNEIDVISNITFSEKSTYENLKKKGAFVDLYEFLDNDPEINRSTLNEHILSVNETDGKLCTIPLFYTVHSVSGKSEYVGNKENWTFDEMIAHWDKMPANAKINGSSTKESAYCELLRNNLCSFVDYENGVVHFDSPDFRKALEFCNRFEYGEWMKFDLDYDALQFCVSGYIDSYNAAIDYDQYTSVGYPSSNGRGAYLMGFRESFSICANSSKEKQQGAWEFIRTFFTPEWQEENAMSDMGGGSYSQQAFCVNKQANENIRSNFVNHNYSPEEYESKGETYQTKYPTLENCLALEEYINSIQYWYAPLDNRIVEAIEPEIFAYFADQITVDECIERIQNMATIWISEQS